MTDDTPVATERLLPATLETDRLRLRPPAMADAEWIFRDYARDHETTRYLTWRPHTDIADTLAFLATVVGGEERPGRRGYNYVLCMKDTPSDGPGLGMIGLTPDSPAPTNHSVSMGYVLAPAHRGHGYMTEAGRALVEAALAHPAIWRVWAGTDVENVASQRTLLRIGMRYEGTLRRFIRHPNIAPSPRDTRLFARVRDE